MRLRLPLLLTIALLLSACAGKNTAPALAAQAPQTLTSGHGHEYASPEVPAENAQPVEVAIAMPVVTDTQAANQELAATAENKAASPASASAEVTQTITPHTQAEDDFVLLYGNGEYDPVADPTLPSGVVMAPVHDPWEPLNRRVHAFNNFVDRYLVTPLARAYVAVIPRPVRLGISNFFNNLRQPLSAFNALLQGRPADAGFSLIRFTLNMTLGLGGLFDPATRFNVPHINEDFGQTLAVWGWRQSRYLELPIFGPRTLRDVFGMLADTPFSALPHISNNKTRAGLQALQLADIRSRLFSVDSMREGVADEYLLYRDAWLQRRNYQILRDLEQPDLQQDGLPDYLTEPEDNPSIPADGIPVDIRP
ncbi:MAG: VacJ family lipoprotein [Pseudomonadota bacterium]|nr:VacJ family lipoprotein [Pseudomonadota bacterium]